MAKVLDCNFIVSEFDLLSLYYVHVQNKVYEFCLVKQIHPGVIKSCSL